MKILHLGNLKSGIDTYVRNTVKLANNNFEFVIVNGADDNSEPFMRNGKQIKTYSISMYRALNPIKDTVAILQTIRIIWKEKPDLVHCHSAKGGVIGRFAAFFTGTKVAYTAHAFSFLSAKSAKKRFFFLLLEKFSKLHSYLIACSNSERELSVNEVKFSKKKALVWNNAVPDSNQEIQDEVNELPTAKKYICSIGRPSFQKNPLFMVELAKAIHDVHPEIKFYLLGVGFHSPMLEEMKALIHKYGLDDIFILKPWLSHKETLHYVKGSLLYFMTSLYEGLPISVIEAMSLSKAIVASDVIGNKDCVKNEYNGYLLPLDVELFTKKMIYLIENKEKREEFERNSRNYFESDFYINNRIKKLEDIYTDILNR